MQSIHGNFIDDPFAYGEYAVARCIVGQKRTFAVAKTSPFYPSALIGGVTFAWPNMLLEIQTEAMVAR